VGVGEAESEGDGVGSVVGVWLGSSPALGGSVGLGFPVGLVLLVWLGLLLGLGFDDGSGLPVTVGSLDGSPLSGAAGSGFGDAVFVGAPVGAPG
jgi:hypothetical protein